MGCFEKCTTPLTARLTDRSKHVNYIDGMVLGVDEFMQEFAYLTGRDEWMMRDALGYGTVCGLHPYLESDAEKARIVVTAGNAVSPSGRMIHVPDRRCSTWLHEWLKDKSDTDEFLAVVTDSPPSMFDLPVYVTVRYRDCPVDEVPIPGAPCRTEEDSTAPSRIADNFLLELRLEKPVQREEDAVRGFVKWLKESLVVTDAADPRTMPVDEFMQALRISFGSTMTDIDPPWEMPASPPDTLLLVGKHDLQEFMHAVMRFWVTEVRPLYRARGLWSAGAYSCPDTASPTQTDDDCVLLAEVLIPLRFNEMDGRWIIDYDALNAPQYRPVNESQRPLLVSGRMMQEFGAMATVPYEGIVSEPAARQVLSIVAAARITHDGTDVAVQQPSFNAVTAKITQGTPGTDKILAIEIGFPGYAEPGDGTFNYSVRVLETGSPSIAAIVSVRFISYSTTGLVLRISKGSTIVKPADIDFMIEIARYSRRES